MLLDQNHGRQRKNDGKFKPTSDIFYFEAMSQEMEKQKIYS